MEGDQLEACETVRGLPSPTCLQTPSPLKAAPWAPFINATALSPCHRGELGKGGHQARAIWTQHQSGPNGITSESNCHIAFLFPISKHRNKERKRVEKNTSSPQNPVIWGPFVSLGGIALRGHNQDLDFSLFCSHSIITHGKFYTLKVSRIFISEGKLCSLL